MIVDPPGLDPAALARAARPPLRAPRVLASVTSTNAVAADAARAGEPEGLVVVAEEQTAGRGRLGRSWVAPPGRGLTCSILLRPPRCGDPLGYLPLLAGVAVVEALAGFTEAPLALKWPNDVLAPDGKLAGILAELVAGAVVLGVGLNVLDHPDLPPGATSLEAAGAARPPERTAVLARVLDRLSARYLEWLRDPGAARAPYLRHCRTIGTAVEVTLPGGEQVRGRAVDVDATGRLLLDTGGGRRALASGDVVHLRAGAG